MLNVVFVLFWLLTPKNSRERHEHGLQHTASLGKRPCNGHLKEEPLLRERWSA